MLEIEEKIKEALDNLPEKYRSVIQEFDVTQSVKKISSNFGLDSSQHDDLDKEVTYLLLQITAAPDFITRIESKLDISEDKAAEITNAVTKKILRPIEKKLSESDTQEEMSVPEPPTKNGDTPTPEYGGNTDPYREPAE